MIIHVMTKPIPQVQTDFSIEENDEPFRVVFADQANVVENYRVANIAINHRIVILLIIVLVLLWASRVARCRRKQKPRFLLCEETWVFVYGIVRAAMNASRVVASIPRSAPSGTMAVAPA